MHSSLIRAQHAATQKRGDGARPAVMSNTRRRKQKLGHPKLYLTRRTTPRHELHGTTIHGCIHPVPRHPWALRPEASPRSVDATQSTARTASGSREPETKRTLGAPCIGSSVCNCPRRVHRTDSHTVTKSGPYTQTTRGAGDPGRSLAWLPPCPSPPKRSPVRPVADLGSAEHPSSRYETVCTACCLLWRMEPN